MRITHNLQTAASASYSERFTLSQVARKLDVHLSTVVRWATKGVRQQRLKTSFIGGRRFCYAADLDEFLLALNSAPGAIPRAPSATKRAAEAERRLDDLGI